MDIGGYIFMIFFIAVAVGVMIVMPIITVVNAHREKSGKEPLFKGRTRKIVIVNKCVSECVYYDGGPIPAMSVDYRVVGGKILHTKDIVEELFDRIAVGQTYKALIRDGAVKKIELC